jgi:hypothetical protein
MRKALILLAPLLLAGCVDGTASYSIDGNDRAIVMHAQQDRPWDKSLSLQLIAINLPACQRQFDLGKVAADRLDVELYGYADGVFTLQAGSRLWRVETNTCGQLAPASTAGGKPLGAFRLIADKLVFVEAGSTTMASR